MAATTAKPPRELPSFFSRIVALDPTAHKDLRVNRTSGFGFAASSQFVPIGLGEIEAAAQNYPVLFTASAVPVAVALMGLEAGRNLFVRGDGTWEPDTYIPAFVRTFPFVLLEVEGRADIYVGMQADAACLSTEHGELLFENEQRSQTLNDAIALAGALRKNLSDMEQLAQVLDQAGLLEQEEAKIDFAGGGSAIVRGFKVLKRDRLDKITDDTFLHWRYRKWLPAIYAHLFSSNRWINLVDGVAYRRRERKIADQELGPPRSRSQNNAPTPTI
jgi:hypothetical protein